MSEKLHQIELTESEMDLIYDALQNSIIDIEQALRDPDTFEPEAIAIMKKDLAEYRALFARWEES